MGQIEQPVTARVERLLPWSGLAALVLMLVPGFLLPQLPAWGSAPDQLSGALRAHDNIFLASRFLFALATVFFLLFVASIVDRLRGADRDDALVIATLCGGIAMAVGELLVTLIQVAMVLLAGQGGTADSLQTLNGLAYAAGNYAVAFPMAVFLVAGSAAMLRRGLARGWIGWVGVIAAVGMLVATLASTDDSPLGLFGFLGFILYAVWTIAVVVALLRRRGAYRVVPATAVA